MGCATTGVTGEPVKEWMTSHIKYPCAVAQQQLAVYYMGASIAQSMRQAAGCMVLGQRCQRNGNLVAAVIVCEHQHDDNDCSADHATTYTGSSSSSSSSFSSRQEESWWWEFGVTLRLASLVLPDSLLRCLKYQEQQHLSALKGAALANVKQEYYNKKATETAAAAAVSTTTTSTIACTKSNNNNTCWSVEMVAIDPTRQGQGHGKALVAILCNLADAAAVPCRLESASRRNTQFYQQAGFSVLSTLSIPDPTTVDGGVALNLSLMRRWPVVLSTGATGPKYRHD